MIEFMIGFLFGMAFMLLLTGYQLVKDNVAWPDYPRDPTRPEWKRPE